MQSLAKLTERVEAWSVIEDPTVKKIVQQINDDLAKVWEESGEIIPKFLHNVLENGSRTYVFNAGTKKEYEIKITVTKHEIGK